MDIGAQRIGIVGFGLLGRAFASRLKAAGFGVEALDVAAERRADMEHCCIGSVGSLRELAERSDTLVLVVFDTEQVLEVVAELSLLVATAQVARCPALVCSTTLDPEMVSELAASIPRGAALVEFPVSGTSAQVLAGDGLGLVGGEASEIAAVRSVIEAITPTSVHAGALGSAARLKLGINLVLELNRSALAEGFVFAEAMGLDLPSFEAALRLSAAASRVMEGKGPKMRAGDFSPEGRCSQSLKDVRLMLASAARRGQALPLTSAQAALLAASVEAGEGNLDGSVVIQELRRRRSNLNDSASSYELRSNS